MKIKTEALIKYYLNKKKKCFPFWRLGCRTL